MYLADNRGCILITGGVTGNAASALFAPTGADNNIIFRAKKTDADYDGLVVTFVHDATRTVPLAEFDGANTLTIYLNSGVTTA